MYTHGSKSLCHVRKMSADDGSLDTSSPGPSNQQTEPATSVSSEGEVKPDKEEASSTSDVTLCTPESHVHYADITKTQGANVSVSNLCYNYTIILTH